LVSRFGVDTRFVDGWVNAMRSDSAFQSEKSVSEACSLRVIADLMFIYRVGQRWSNLI